MPKLHFGETLTPKMKSMMPSLRRRFSNPSGRTLAGNPVGKSKPLRKTNGFGGVPNYSRPPRKA